MKSALSLVSAALLAVALIGAVSADDSKPKIDVKRAERGVDAALTELGHEAKKAGKAASRAVENGAESVRRTIRGEHQPAPSK